MKNPSIIYPLWDERAKPGRDATRIIGESTGLGNIVRGIKLRKTLLYFVLGKEKNISEDFLREFKKSSSQELCLEGYSLKKNARVFRNAFLKEKGRRIYRDAPYQFILKKDKKFISNIGFIPFRKFILIQQIQGVYKSKKALAPIKWSKMLVRIVTNWAEEFGIENVCILPSSRNRWDRVNGQTERRKLIYDVTAKREGFRYDPRLKVYVKNLQQTSVDNYGLQALIKK